MAQIASEFDFRNKPASWKCEFRIQIRVWNKYGSRTKEKRSIITEGSLKLKVLLNQKLISSKSQYDQFHTVKI